MIGWYDVTDPANEKPFLPHTAITRDTVLQAKWRRTGEYSVVYSVDAVDETGEPLMADDVRVQGWNSPVDSAKYADQSDSAIMDKMSGAAKGYRRRIVSEPPDMYGVDILSCPYHELAKQLGAEKAVLCICHLDKAYMKGFHHIRYERTTAVSEGAGCCDYRLRYDPEKD